MEIAKAAEGRPTMIESKLEKREVDSAVITPYRNAEPPD